MNVPAFPRCDAVVLCSELADMSMEQFVRQVEEAGYSVAVGTASHSAGGIDIDALVKKAEQRMYLDKSRHYEQLRRGTEE